MLHEPLVAGLVVTIYALGHAPRSEGAAGSGSPADRETFFAAIQARDGARVEALLAKNPSLAAARSSDGTSAVLAAAFLLDGPNFLGADNPIARAIFSRRPPLDVFEAAVAGETRRVRELLDEDPARLRAFSRSGWTPLHFAAFGGRVETMELLLSRGAEPDVRSTNRFGNTPLQAAILPPEATVAAAKLLVEHGANVNARQNESFTSLHEAAFSGNLEVIEFLLSRGADLRATTEEGRTPLEVARQRNQSRAAEVLARGR